MEPAEPARCQVAIIIMHRARACGARAAAGASDGSGFVHADGGTGASNVAVEG
jgi:hypothetical protein